MKKTTAAILSLVVMAGAMLSFNNVDALSWSEKRANTTAINEAIQTRQNNYYRSKLRSEAGINNRDVLKNYHNKNIWNNYVTRRSTKLNREGELADRTGIRQNTGYVAAANNSKMTMRKGWICYLIRHEAPGEDCYTMGQIDGEQEGRISTRMERVNESALAAIIGAVRDLNKAAMRQEVNEDAVKRPSNYTTQNSRRYFKSPFQKNFKMAEDLDI